QAVERRFELTRACLKVLAGRARRPVFVLTRSRLVERDIDVLSSMPDARVGVSIPTIDDDVRRHFEPRGASIEERLAVLGAMRAAGIQTFAVVQPMLPGSARDLAEALAKVAGSVSIDVLHGVEGAGADFGDPRFSHATDEVWQREQAGALADELGRRG